MAVSAVGIIGGGDQAQRRKRDFYPTPSDVTHSLMYFLKSEGLTPSHVWECACGEYHMSNVISEYTRVVATDIVYGQDFLTSEIPNGVTAIITNPPFNLSAKFIRRAMSYNVPLVAMVLKSQYWHSQERQVLFNDYRPAFILPLTWRPDFTGKGAPTMDMLWTVRVNGKTVTEYRPLTKIPQRMLF